MSLKQLKSSVAYSDDQNQPIDFVSVNEFFDYGFLWPRRIEPRLSSGEFSAEWVKRSSKVKRELIGGANRGIGLELVRQSMAWEKDLVDGSLRQSWRYGLRNGSVINLVQYFIGPGFPGRPLSRLPFIFARFLFQDKGKQRLAEGSFYRD